MWATLRSRRNTLEPAGRATAGAGGASLLGSAQHPTTLDDRALLLILLASEAERLEMFHTPMGGSDALTLKIDVLLTLQPPLNTNWRSLAAHAWSLSPALLLHLLERLPQPTVSVPLRAEIEQLMANDWHAARREPAALEHLVSPRAVAEQAPQLRSLLTWARSTPPVAMSLLEKRYGGAPLLVQYAIRVLRSFEPETIIFYSPQLFQGECGGGGGGEEFFFFFFFILCLFFLVVCLVLF